MSPLISNYYIQEIPIMVVHTSNLRRWGKKNCPPGSWRWRPLSSRTNVQLEHPKPSQKLQIRKYIEKIELSRSSKLQLLASPTAVSRSFLPLPASSSLLGTIQALAATSSVGHTPNSTMGITGFLGRAMEGILSVPELISTSHNSDPWAIRITGRKSKSESSKALQNRSK